MKHIKNLLEYTKYSDEMLNNIPPELVDDIVQTKPESPDDYLDELPIHLKSIAENIFMDAVENKKVDLTVIDRLSINDQKEILKFFYNINNMINRSLKRDIRQN